MSDQETRRVARDEHGPRATFEEIEIGKDLGALEWTVQLDEIATQIALDDDPHPWFTGDSPFGGTIAPPQLAYRPPRWLLSRNYNVRGLLYKWEFENLLPLRPGMRLTVKGRITDKWIKAEREFVAYEAWGENEAGERVFHTRRVQILDVIKRTVPREGAGVDSGVKKERIA